MQSFYNAITQLSDIKRELTGVMLAQNLASSQIATLTTSLTNQSNNYEQEIMILNYINNLVINVIVQIVDALTIVINVLLMVVTDLFEIGFPLINMIINVILQIFGPPGDPVVTNSTSIVTGTAVDVINVIDGESAPPAQAAGDMINAVSSLLFSDNPMLNGKHEHMLSLSTKLQDIALKLSGDATTTAAPAAGDIPASVAQIGTSLDLRASELSAMMGDLKVNMKTITEKLASLAAHKND